MALNVNRKIGTPTVRFNPHFYKQAYAQYRNGIYRDVIEMINRAEIDSHVAGCLTGRRAGFQKGFTVVPYDDDASDIERATWLTNVIKNLRHRRLFKDIQKAVLKKFSVLDFEWEIIDSRQVPVSYTWYEHKFFKYDLDDGILKIDHGRRLEEIPPEALVCEIQETPILLPVLRDYILKDFGLEAWAGFIEVFGEGIILGKYPPGVNKEFRDELETGIESLARSSRGTIPEGSNIDVIESQRTTGDHDRFVEVANDGIAISILGHANAVQQSKGLQVGENLTAYEVKREVAVDDMYFIEECMQNFIRIVVERNFGDGRFPTFEMDKKPPIDMKLQLDILDTAYNHGLVIDPSEYAKLGLIIQPDQDFIQKQQLNLLD